MAAVRGWIVSVLFGACSVASFPSVHAADTYPETCERYAVRGVLPGMSERQVRRALGGKPIAVRTLDGDRPVVTRTATWRFESAEVEVTFERPPGRRFEVVRVSERDALEGSVDLAAEILDRLGASAEELERVRTADDGSAVWLDAFCSLAVRARVETASWWEREGASITHDVVTADRADAAGWLDLDAPEPETPTESEAEPRAPRRLVPVVAGTEGLVDPVLIWNDYVAPEYPEAARDAGVGGRVVLLARVGVDGRVHRLETLSVTPTGYGFEKAAIDAVWAWRFEPGTMGGRPVEVLLTIEVEIP